MSGEVRTMVSPCRQVCRLGSDRVCDGCGRTIDEIATWFRMAPDARAVVMARVAGWQVREAAGGGSK